MGMFTLLKRADGEREDMARKGSKPQANAATAAYVAQLQAAKIDEASFDAILERLTGDTSMSAADVIAVAAGYAIVGGKPTSKRAALDKIRRRFVELVRKDAKNVSATKQKPW